MKSGRLFAFGPYRLDEAERLLYRGDDLVALTPKVFDTLLLLVEQGGHVVGKDELMRRLWPESFVEESSLSQNISLLRKALAGEGEQYIQTVPKRGYRFVAEVSEVPAAADEPGAGEVEPEAGLGAGERRHRPGAVFALVGCVTLSAAALLHFYQTRWGAHAGPAPPRSVAVLPFKTVGVDEDERLLGLGMADALIIRLGAQQRTTVLPLSSVFRYTADEKDALAAGRELGVDAVLEGTVQRSGGAVRVTAQLISLDEGKILWAGKFDDKYENIFALQDSVSGRLAAAVAPRLSGDGRAGEAGHFSPNTEAYQSYLFGLYFWNTRTKEGLARAVEHFKKAVELDPDYARAHAGLADSYYLIWNNDYDTVPSQVAVQGWYAAARKALELDDSLAEAHVVMAPIRQRQGDLAGAEREFRRALELNPNLSVARVRYTYFLYQDLKLDAAVEQARRAQELDPTSPSANATLGFVLSLARRYDESIQFSRKALGLGHESYEAHMNLGEAYLLKGMPDEALAEFEAAREGMPGEALLGVAKAHAAAGRRAEAERALHEEEQLKRRAQMPRYDRVVTYALLGDRDTAFAWLDEVRLARMVVANLKYDPHLDSLRSDPRFGDFVRRNKLEQTLAAGD
ncbi:MAG TPA: tetratricopeptide repeat protein [Pyrinomonadaceae bacterium]|nr:tetratricopeptide repeat protein [Pyrinomonadaceae bacterium]